MAVLRSGALFWLPRVVRLVWRLCCCRTSNRSRIDPHQHQIELAGVLLVFCVCIVFCVERRVEQTKVRSRSPSRIPYIHRFCGGQTNKLRVLLWNVCYCYPGCCGCCGFLTRTKHHHQLHHHPLWWHTHPSKGMQRCEGHFIEL